MVISELAESFKIMNQPDPPRPWRYLTTYFLENIEERSETFQHNIDSSVQFVLYKFRIDIFDSLETLLFSAS